MIFLYSFFIKLYLIKIANNFSFNLMPQLVFTKDKELSNNGVNGNLKIKGI